MAAQSWDYAVVLLEKDMKKVGTQLRKLGSDGWELVSVVQQCQVLIDQKTPGYWAYLKRPAKAKNGGPKSGASASRYGRLSRS